jgi:phosphatidylserine/phosphatidylglycerophosphate/cardiolipin synthase-like enzyme
MWTTPELLAGANEASAATLQRLASAFRNGQLGAPLSEFAIAQVAPCPSALVETLLRLSAEGMATPHLGLVLALAADAAETRMQADVAAELVWTGPEASNAGTRDTAVVLDDLFANAQRSIVVSTFTVHDPQRVFKTLAERLDRVQDLRVRVVVHIGRKPGDTRVESMLAYDYAQWLGDGWPGNRRPEVYYDPRGLSTDGAVRASWHAKFVVVDEEIAFVTSANFTEWAQQRNVEAGVLLRNRLFAEQLSRQVDGLIDSNHLIRLSSF